MQTVKILPTTETLAKVGVKSRNTVHDWVKSQDFPKPVQLGGNRIGWIESEVDAWLETNLRKERQMEGIAKAKEKGVYKGRKPSVDVARVKELRDSGMGASAIAKEMGIGRASVYRALG